jgi:predicted Zn-dependent protease
MPAHSTARPTRLLSLALAAALCVQALPVHAQNSLPSLGDAASDDLDVNDERRLGEQIMADIRRDPAFLDDPVLQAYVEGLWSPLVSSARGLGHIGSDLDRPFAWELFLVREPSVNAFALPGGHVGVYLGLLAMTTHPDELASVLAHELTHVTQRHIARSIGSSKRVGMVSLAGLLLGVLLAARAGNVDAASAAIASGQAAMAQGQLNFSRDMEREADRIGFSMLESAGFATPAMASMFEKLSIANRLNDSGHFPYLRSHPLTTERIAEARSRVGEVPLPPPPVLHELMRARARALMDPTSGAWRRLQSTPVAGTETERLAALYLRALVSTKLQEPDAAREAVAQALALVTSTAFPEEVRASVRALAVEVWLAVGRTEEARAIAAGLGPSRPALLLRAQAVRAAATVAGATASSAVPGTASPLKTSLEELQTWLSDHPRDAAAWRELSQSAAAAGQPVRARRADAEAQAAAGDLPGAIDRLRTARRIDSQTEAIELHVVDARLRAMEAQLRALTPDEPPRRR